MGGWGVWGRRAWGGEGVGGQIWKWKVVEMKDGFAVTRKSGAWLMAALVLILLASLAVGQAQDEGGVGFFADELGGVAHASTPPDAPTFAILIVGNGNLRVSWFAVSGATKYEVAYSDDNGANWTSHANDLTGTSVIIGGINYHKVWVARVRAGNSNGWSGWKVTNQDGPYSDEKVVSTPIDDESRQKLIDLNNALRSQRGGGNYGLPSKPPAAAPYIHFTNIAQTTATLNVVNYNATWSYKQGTTGSCVGSQSASTTNLTSLSPNTTYKYQAWTNGNCGGASFARDSFTTLPITLAASGIGRTTATLTIAGHSSQWWYKADVGPDDTCQGPVAAGTSAESLTGLTEETAYVYKAYSLSGCGAANLLATAASFTTLAPPHVTNLSTTVSGDSDVNSSRQQGVDFTTGPNSTGYTLTSVILPMRYKTTGTGTLAITLHEQSSSSPSSTTKATLTGTAPTSSSWTNTVWTCSGSGCELEAGTKYFIVATLTGTGEYALQYSAVEEVETTTPSDSGWNIGYSHFKIAGQVWSSWNDLHLVRVNFEFNPTLTASNVTSSSATLTLDHHDGTWYSKRMHPDTSFCSVAVTGATQNRDSLTSNVTYAYTAFSDSACRTELDTAYFSTTDAAVGNLKETQASTSWTIGGGSHEKYATAFTTGGNSSGYTLEAVTLDFAAKSSSPGDISVALHAASGSDPAATASATLSGSDPDAAGLQTYTCSGSGCDLSASTTYFIVTSVPTGAAGGSYNQRNTASDSESVQSPATGWSIANAGRYKGGILANWTAANSASMHIAANVKPPTLDASGITGTAATLTIGNHTGNWHHKETHTSTTATCSSANAGTTASLSSLTADKFYAFTAYSDSGCTDANALATAYFSTTDDGVGNLNAESDFNISVGRGGSNNQSVTAPFATGSSASILESVTLRFADKSAAGTPGNIAVTIHEPDTSNSNPASTTKATLSGSNPDTAGLYSYTCSSGCYLNANSTYFVKAVATSATGTARYSLNLTQSDDEVNHPSDNGWSIGDQGRHKSQRFAWTNHGVGRVANMHVAANDAPTLVASSVGATTATLTIGGHTAAWWYDADSGPDTTCSSVAADTSTASLTGLTAGTDYVYSAYSKTGCGDADLIAVADVFTTSVSVSNLTETAGSAAMNLASNNGWAQEFDTGSASGYAIQSVTVDFKTVTSASAITVAIHNKETGGDPSATARATLTGTPAVGQVEFTCDATNTNNDCTLSGDASYFVHVSATSSAGSLDNTDSDGQTLVPSGNGWSIENTATSKSGSTWTTHTSASMMIKVEATPQATLSAGSIEDDSATLTMKYHSGDWWLKADKGFFSVNCERVSGTSANLNNRLYKQTTYVFTAYSDSGCTTANALDSVTFKTTGTVISVSSVSGTGATLTIAGHTAAWWYDADSGPDATCQSVAANTSSDTLTGLTDGNTYTYTAYSKTGCNAVDELDSVTFSTSDVSVGNLGEQADNASCSIGYSGANNVKCATAFTTGGNSAGYTLKSVTGLFDAKFRNPGDIVVAIHAADTTNSNHPAASASITLTGSDPDAAGLHTYTCSTGCDLTANTTYFVVMSTADASAPRKLYSWRRTTSDDETVRPTTATGWAIANAGLQDIGSGWTALPRNHTGVMHVAADEITPGLTATSVSSTGATLTISGHTGTWSYNARVDSGNGTCTTPVSSSTTTATLLASKTFEITAYSGAGCVTANALDTIYISTTDAFVGNLGTATTFGALGNVGFGTHVQRATAFTTGNATNGYSLNGVTIQFNAKNGSPADIVVAIHAADTSNSLNPAATATATLSGSDPDTAGLYTYTCSTNCDLAKETTYFVVLSAPSSPNNGYYRSRLTTSDDETPHPSGSGWVIADVGRLKFGSAAWAGYTNGETGVMHIAANAKTS